MRAAASDGDEAIVRRLERAASRAPRPEAVLRLVLAAARVAWPDARVDLFARRPRRPWRSAGNRPGGTPLAPSLRGPRSERGRRAGDESGPPGRDVLAEAGLRQRIVATARPRGLRVAMTAARAGEPWPGDASGLLAEFLSIATPALLGLSRRERLEEALRDARALGRFTAQLNRSLELEDTLRLAVDGLRRTASFDAARLVLAGPHGERSRLVLDPDAARLSDGESGDDERAENRRGRRGMRWEQADEDPRLERALASGRAFRQSGLGQGSGASPAERTLAAAGHRSRLVVPLVAGRRVVGAFELLSHGDDPAAGRHLSSLRHVAKPMGLAVENARLYREAEQRARQMEALHEVALALGSADDVDDVMARVLTILHETFAFEHSAVLTLEREPGGEDVLVLQAARGYSVRRDGSFRIPLSSSTVTSRAARSGTLVHVRDVQAEPDYVPGVERGRSEVALPLLVGGRVVGVLDVESQSVDAFTPSQLETLRLFSTQVALALQRARVFERVRQQARTDSLTGLLNQRAFRAKVAREIDRSRRTGRPFVLGLIDLDDFKQVNDRLGHEVGNHVIARVGEVLRERVRSIDAAARFGGDEFALVLSETDASGAAPVLEHVRESLAAPSAGVPAVPVSIGMAEWTPSMRRVSDIIVEADRALYGAKARGKGRVVVATPQGGTASASPDASA